ncbi:MAG: hypothetical protein ABR985_05485 [Methanotrichaceae archaeon]|jgi:hypothetical protein
MIQEAVAAAEDRDVITVDEGNYPENIRIDKSLKIIWGWSGQNHYR